MTLAEPYARIVFMGERYKSYGMLGKKHSNETKKKLSRASKGKKRPPFSAEWREKIAASRRGKSSWNKGLKYTAISKEKHWNWQGGITSESLAARASAEYKRWRTSVFKRDGYACVIGGKTHGNKLIADHIKSFSKYPSLRFKLSNGRTLCEECHKLTDNYCGRAFKK